MTSNAAAIIFDRGLSTQQVSIGRLVSDLLEPDNDFVDPPESFQRVVKTTVLKDYECKLVDVLDKAPSQKVSLKLTELLGASHEYSATSSLQIETKEATQQTLPDYSSAFKTLVDCSQAEDGIVLSWIQDKIDQGAHYVYFVVGVHTIKDAELSVVDSADKSHDVNPGIPVTDVVSHGVSAQMDNNSLDFMVSLSLTESDVARRTFQNKVNRVVAVQYCSIRLKKLRLGDESPEEPNIKCWPWVTRQPYASGGILASQEQVGEGIVDGPVTGEALRKLEEDQPDGTEVNTVLVGDLELVF